MEYCSYISVTCPYYLTLWVKCMFRILQCWNVACTAVKYDVVPLTITSQLIQRDERPEGRELLLTSVTFDRLSQISISCELEGSIRASSCTFLFGLSTLISFFSFFLPFHFRATRPSFLPFFRASSFFFLFLLSLFFENCIGRRLTNAYTFSVHPWIQFSHLRVNHLKVRRW